MPSLTVQVPNLHHLGPVMQVRIAVGKVTEDAMLKAGTKSAEPLPSVAMVDTGATGTVVSEDIIKQLGLQPVGACTIHTPSSSNVPCYEYLVRLVLPNNLVIGDVVAIGAPLHGQHIQLPEGQGSTGYARGGMLLSPEGRRAKLGLRKCHGLCPWVSTA